MSFVPREYPDIVRDLLTMLTGGITRETLSAPGPGELRVPQKLKRRPVRRVSSVSGFVPFPKNVTPPAGASEYGARYTFTPADFALVASGGDGNDSIEFRPNGRHPTPHSPLLVNYYPVEIDNVPLTDLNVGSVTRTIVETFARELALSDLGLEKIYQSAFLESAEGSALDRVVALVGVQRLPAGFPVVRLTFSRRVSTPGRITIPVRSTVTDKKGNRYQTLDERTMEPNELTLEVMAAGESLATPEVAENTLTTLEVLIAGISEVTNPQASRKLSAPETDEDLRRRAKGALHGAVRGTRDALEFRIKSVKGVKDVKVVERPNGVAGEVRITVAYSDENAETRKAVDDAIDEVRPAGVRVISGDAARVRVAVRVSLTVAGTGVTGADAASLKSSCESRLAKLLSTLAPGATVRRAQLVAAAMQDARIVDAKILLVPDGKEPTESVTLEASETLDLVQPFTIDTAPERVGDQPATTASVSASIPLHLVAGVTREQATSAITTAFKAHLATRTPGMPLTVDSLVAGLRDDTRYAIARDEVLVTVEAAGGRFVQLTDAAGTYVPVVNERLTTGALDISVREGGA